MMIRLTYISSAKQGVDDYAAMKILSASRANNRRDGLTGLLLFDGVRFLQALEGDPKVVNATYERIKADPRHRACVQLGRADITERAFGDWDMAWRRLVQAGEGVSLSDTVDKMVAQVPDANTRALFSSFAKFERAIV